MPDWFLASINQAKPIGAVGKRNAVLGCFAPCSWKTPGVYCGTSLFKAATHPGDERTIKPTSKESRLKNPLV